VTDCGDCVAALLEAKLPLSVESDGAEDVWDVVGPALVAATTRHLRAVAHLQAAFPSAVIIWQLVRSMFEYAATGLQRRCNPVAALTGCEPPGVGRPSRFSFRRAVSVADARPRERVPSRGAEQRSIQLV
jgi:hypothetical protein